MERRESPLDPQPKPSGPTEETSGPKRLDSQAPMRERLLQRMKKVDPKQAERYRQRTGE
ncbi:MAG: ubiquitin-like protein UBact [Nitrospirales bacterium]|nr:ubiquitin-like protein UBact [Nitrospirales bacterium]